MPRKFNPSGQRKSTLVVLKTGTILSKCCQLRILFLMVKHYLALTMSMILIIHAKMTKFGCLPSSVETRRSNIEIMSVIIV